MALSRGTTIALMAAFLLTGSINTLTKWYQFHACSPTHDPKHDVPVTDKGQGVTCAAGTKTFNKPWSQNMLMFFGESLLIWLFLSKRRSRTAAMQERELALAPGGVERPKTPFYIFAFPASCDVLGTGIGGVGMSFISASVWQMMRGSLVIFTAIFSVTFLKRKLYAYNWLAVFTTTCGLCCIGLSAVLDDGAGGNSIMLGIFFTVVAQAFSATQMVVEELFVKSRNAAPEQIVGSEGIWGIMIMIVMLVVMYYIPGKDDGSFENALDSIYMVGHGTALDAFIGVYLVSIACFNFLGVTMAGKLSAVHRTVVDSVRTSLVWIVQMVAYYFVDKDYGKGWEKHSWLQLVGFLILVLGTLIYNAIIKVPGLYYPPPEPPAVPMLKPQVGDGNRGNLVEVQVEEQYRAEES